jgi:hypothetical protein
MYGVSIDTLSQEKDKTHQIFLLAHPLSLYDMPHLPPTIDPDVKKTASESRTDHQSTILAREQATHRGS